jgi:hypothetical protein
VRYKLCVILVSPLPDVVFICHLQHSVSKPTEQTVHGEKLLVSALVTLQEIPHLSTPCLRTSSRSSHQIASPGRRKTYTADGSIVRDLRIGDEKSFDGVHQPRPQKNTSTRSRPNRCSPTQPPRSPPYRRAAFHELRAPSYSLTYKSFLEQIS